MVDDDGKIRKTVTHKIEDFILEADESYGLQIANIVD